MFFEDGNSISIVGYVVFCEYCTHVCMSVKVMNMIKFTKNDYESK